MVPSPFVLEEFFTTALYGSITEVRVRTPEVFAERAASRRRPTNWVQSTGNVVILAGHPARYVTKSAHNDLAMGNRYSYLGRLIRVLSSPWCDGILGYSLSWRTS
jgi:hypothetical protein